MSKAAQETLTTKLFNPAAGRLLSHPVVLAAMLILALNDHWLKAACPGWITGKLSDFAGLIFFPPMLAFLGIPLRWSAVLTATAFTLVKSVPFANDCWNEFFGAVYRTIGYARGANLLCDVTDLLALPCTTVCLFLGGTKHVHET